ncbi:MAG: 4-hydroxy-tetrahydrodipicolinate synthase [Oligoflexales bacterium]
MNGVWTALATPFQASGDIDWEAFDRLLDFQSQASVHGIVLIGTTGEAPTLAVSEKLALIRRARARLPHIKLMSGAGSNDTKQAVEFSRLAADSGMDALLVVTPPYNKPSLNGLKAHYEAIAKIGVPVCLYHVPGRTGQLLSAHDMQTLTEIPGVQLIKEASGSLELFSQTRLQTKVDVLSGDDPTYLASLSVGGAGCISVVSNIFPRAMVEMTRLFQEGRCDNALKIHEALLPMIQVLFCESNPCPLKVALEHLELCANVVRLPLAVVEDHNKERIQKTVDATCKKLAEIMS